jgi:subtilisin-like proprotein convertase family protein
MKQIVLTPFAFLLFLFNIDAQVFQGKGGYIQDYFGEYTRQEFLCEVYNLPKKIDTSFGVESVHISIHHNRVSDLKVTLEAPDGSAVWLTNRNGRDSGQDYRNTSFSMNTQKYIHQAEAPFIGEYIPDGRMEYLNNEQNPNGYWKLIVEDLRSGVEGVLDSFSITFSNHPARFVAKKICSFENPELCVCANRKKNGDLLPDLVMLPSFTRDQIKEYAWNDTNFPGQLRFAATIANIGYGPMEIKGAKKWYCNGKEVDSAMKCPDGNNSRQTVVQKIFYKKGDSLKHRDVEAGTMYFDDHPGHNHYHIDNWVEFRLLAVNGKKKKLVISEGSKVSFCLFNSGICTNGDKVCNIYSKDFGETMPNYGLGNYSSCGVDKQGISVGGYDTYGMMYEGQFLQLPKGIKSGTYLLEIEIDPEHKYKESNKKNNTLQMKVSISLQE